MGGGKKKRSITQMTKTKKVDKEKRKSKNIKNKQSTSSKNEETKNLRIIVPDIKDKGFLKEIQKMKVLTPYTVATRFNLRLSVAKELLKELHKKNKISFISSGRNIRIYKPSE
jgi:small subunit ribosomal protein S25e